MRSCAVAGILELPDIARMADTRASSKYWAMATLLMCQSGSTSANRARISTVFG
jgi:hypothetical protein